MRDVDGKRCVLVETVDGSLHAYRYPDEQAAADTYDLCRADWNSGGRLLFYLARRTRFTPSQAIIDGNEVAHLELTTPDDAEERGAVCRDAYVFG